MTSRRISRTTLSRALGRGVATEPTQPAPENPAPHQHISAASINREIASVIAQRVADAIDSDIVAAAGARPQESNAAERRPEVIGVDPAAPGADASSVNGRLIIGNTSFPSRLSVEASGGVSIQGRGWPPPADVQRALTDYASVARESGLSLLSSEESSEAISRLQGQRSIRGTVTGRLSSERPVDAVSRLGLNVRLVEVHYDVPTRIVTFYFSAVATLLGPDTISIEVPPVEISQELLDDTDDYRIVVQTVTNHAVRGIQRGLAMYLGQVVADAVDRHFAVNPDARRLINRSSRGRT